jgi:hypothetical protein
MKKKPLKLHSQLRDGFGHLTDVELLRLHYPVTQLECALYARLGNCVKERDAVLTKLNSAQEVLEGARAELGDMGKLNSNLCKALECLKSSARAVVEHWEQGNLARAVNDLRHAVEHV